MSLNFGDCRFQNKTDLKIISSSARGTKNKKCKTGFDKVDNKIDKQTN